MEMFKVTLSEKDLKYIWHPCSQMKDYEELPPIIIKKAKGLYLYDHEDKAYADVISSWWCNLFGHCNNRISKAVEKQLHTLEHVIFANFSHEGAINLCEKLANLLPEGLEKFCFTDNGSAAIEASMKMSFQYHHQTGNPQKKKFMALSDAYHGETLGALSVSGVDLYSKIYKPILLDINRIPGPDCYNCPYNLKKDSCKAECFSRCEEIFEKHGEETAAFIIEPMLQAAAGMKIYSPVYLQKLRKICDEYNVHLIADEIAAGYGRTGKMFACEHAGISPDIMCLSKGLTGGYMPMALAVTTKKIYDAFYADYKEGKAFMHSHTYSGNPLACSAALEVLKIFEDENILENNINKAKYFNSEIYKIFSNLDYIGDIRSIGLINAIQIVKNKEKKEAFPAENRTGYQIYKRALKRGLLLRPLGDVIYFNPPLNITKEEINSVISIASEVIKETLD